MEIQKFPITQKDYESLRKQGATNITQEVQYFLHGPNMKLLFPYSVQQTQLIEDSVLPLTTEDTSSSEDSSEDKNESSSEEPSTKPDQRKGTDIMGLAYNWEDLLDTLAGRMKFIAYAAAEVLTASTHPVTSVQLTKEIMIKYPEDPLITPGSVSGHLSRLVRGGFIINITNPIVCQDAE